MAALTRKTSYPIAAKLCGPGPAAYLLPAAIGWEHHNVTLKRWPCYSMRMQLQIRDYTASPGPARYGYPSHLLYKGMCLDPAYTMRIKPNDLKLFSSPGPAAYTVSVKPIRYRYPEWCMALPALKDHINNYPAPNAYDIRAIIGTKHPVQNAAPQYSMRTKISGTKIDFASPFQDFTHSPSPAAYKVVALEEFKERAPAYTIRNRIEPLKMLKTPGPGTYDPGLQDKPKAPIYSLRLKHSQYEQPVTVKEPDITIDWE
ncbi:hypothetical protein RvY_08161 [Ramazzottius varieornatus]|uniref:Outer dense fiber protein 3 n=1 Tax=Ramazzottius varieornatus TaxID=947166 RepID=A0A1D1V4U0_RAMVA|nr:hypothetical protein RvY_08161 [Ramazzottius varieornatus]